MLNPYVLLAVGVLWAASLGTAYVSGHRNATNAAKAQEAANTARLIKQHNENSVIDMQAAVEAEAGRHAKQVEYRDRVQTVERIVREKPSDCRVSDDVFGLLNAAIDSANNAGTAKPSGLPATTEASFKSQ